MSRNRTQRQTSSSSPLRQQQQQRSRSSITKFLLLCFFTSSTTTTTFAQTTTTTNNNNINYSCNSRLESQCPKRNNGICNSEWSDTPIIGCERSDCFDCSYKCEQYKLDCYGCIQNGCYYCPGDGTCYNSPDYTFGSIAITSCFDSTDYIYRSVTSASATSYEVCGDYFTQEYFTDPLYITSSWVFNMINVVPVWKIGIRGTGIRVRINDGGVNPNHDEINRRFDIDGSCTNDYAIEDIDEEEDDNHATAVAAIVGGEANNGKCSVGVAPEVTLSSCIVFDRSSDFLIAKLDSMDISQNSYGASACIWDDRRERRHRERERRILRDEEDEEIKKEDEEDDRRRRERELQSSTSSYACPFTYDNPWGTLPCDSCGGTIFTPPLSRDCEEAIILHCDYFYEHDPNGCLEFLDLFLEDGTCYYNSLSSQERDYIQQGIQQGRNGLGIIYVFAAGNDYTAGADTNMEGYLNTRFTISVGAVGKDEKHASYGTPGAALFVTAPGGDQESITNHVTAHAAGGCYEAGQGTSFSCPVVSGVLALVLNMNPNLSWRDVQGILAVTSRMVVIDDKDDTLVTNAAGYHHSNLYGFGIVNAHQAVQAAKTWIPFGPEHMFVRETGILNLIIPDHPSNPVESSVFIARNGNPAVVSSEEEVLRQQQSDNDDDDDLLFATESVVLYLDVRHVSRGDLDIILTSPGGTSSTLHPGNRPETTQLDKDERWKFLTVRSWGESPYGTWTLSITDKSLGQVVDCHDEPSWSFTDMGVKIDCEYFADYEYCDNGVIDVPGMQAHGEAYLLNIQDDEEGMTVSDACCACGGGRDGDFRNEVVQWRLVVYGHYYTLENGVPVMALPIPPPMSSPQQQPMPPSNVNIPPSTPTLVAGPTFGNNDPPPIGIPFGNDPDIPVQPFPTNESPVVDGAGSSSSTAEVDKMLIRLWLGWTSCGAILFSCLFLLD